MSREFETISRSDDDDYDSIGSHSTVKHAMKAITNGRAFASGKDIEENRNALELLISGIGNAGGAGLWFDTMQQVATRGPGGAWSAITGPTFSDIAYTAEDLANADIVSIIERMLPNLPGKGMVFNEWRDQ